MANLNGKAKVMVSKMKKIFSFLFCILLPVIVCAADFGYKITYEGGSVPAAKPDAKLYLDAKFASDIVQGHIRIRVVAGQIRLLNGKTEVARIPASSVTEISYGQDAYRRVAVAIGLGPASFAAGARPLTPSKSTNRYIDIGLVWDDGGKKGGVAFQSDNGGVIRVNVNSGELEYPGLLPALEGITGKKAVDLETSPSSAAPAVAAALAAPADTLAGAAGRGDTIAVQHFLDQGAAADSKNSDDSPTPLIAASERGFLEVVKALIDKGADVNVKARYGLTALIIASQNGHGDVVRALLDKGADANAEMSTGGATPLILASEHGSREAAQALIEKGANVNAKTSSGATALVAASQGGHGDVVQALLDKGADVNAKMTNGVTALMLASQNGYGGIVQALLVRGADVNARMNDGRTALMLAHDANVRAILVRAGTQQ